MMHIILKALRRSIRNRKGANVVEFAIVAAPFFFVLFAIIESGLIFVATVNLSNATMLVSRQLRTGTFVATGLAGQTTGVVKSLADFKAAICGNMQLVSLATCNAQLQVDVRTASSFGKAVTALPIVNGAFSNTSLCFFSGASGSVVELHAYYLWPVTTPLLLGALVNATRYTVGNTTVAGNYHVIVSAEAFRVEQNSNGTNSGTGC